MSEFYFSERDMDLRQAEILAERKGQRLSADLSPRFHWIWAWVGRGLRVIQGQILAWMQSTTPEAGGRGTAPLKQGVSGPCHEA